MSKGLSVEHRGAALWLIIDRPENGNAIDEEVLEAVRGGLRGSEADDGIKVVVLTGAGDKDFCSGSALGQAAASARGAQHSAAGQTLRALMRHPKPVIARINGACTAGGMSLLAVADLVVASSAARFGFPNVRIDPMSLMASALLIHRWGIAENHIFELSLLGEPVDAIKALTMGIVSRVVPVERFDDEIESMVEALAERSSASLGLSKKLLERMRSIRVEDALATAERQADLIDLSQDSANRVLPFFRRQSATE